MSCGLNAKIGKGDKTADAIKAFSVISRAALCVLVVTRSIGRVYTAESGSVILFFIPFYFLSPFSMHCALTL